MIEIKNVSKWFGDFQVLAEVNETVARGQKVVICGPSGSGKSTLLRCINGRCASGSAWCSSASSSTRT